jgi:hypothetical protein
MVYFSEEILSRNFATITVVLASRRYTNVGVERSTTGNNGSIWLRK